MSEALLASLATARPAVTLDLALPAGATCALMGPSGAGKTTALRALAGLVPAQGTVRVGGAVWQDGATMVPARARRVGMVFQSGALFPHLSALDNVREACRGRADADAFAAALLARVRLDGLEHRRPAQLSGGQQQRVALARALAREPDLLLLDEPFAAVDPPVRRALVALIAEVRGTTAAPILFVTHDLADARALASHACFLDAGRQVAFGPAAALLDDTASPLRRWLAG